MARITVEDCILRIPNRFDLVLAAAQRARDISAGGVLTLDRDNDKNPVVALREIAEQNVNPEDLEQDLILSLQRHVEQDEPEDEDLDVVTVGEGLGLTGPDALGGDQDLVQQEIAEDVLAVGEEAVEAGAEISDAAEFDEDGDALADEEETDEPS